MREFVVKDFGKFLELAEMAQTPLKFMVIQSRDAQDPYVIAKFIAQWQWLVFEGIAVERMIERLKKVGFIEVEEREAKSFKVEFG